MPPRAHWLLGVAMAVGMIATSCGGPNEPSPQVFSYSFENGMDGWAARGIDLELGDGFIFWSIAPSRETASAGASALKLYLENWNDQGKIWIEKSFAATPNAEVEVDLSYDFGTKDGGTVNLFRIMAGALSHPAASLEELWPIIRGETGHGDDPDGDFRWLGKRYVTRVRANAAGEVVVMVGVWGTWETPRTYFVDNVRVEIKP